MEMLRSEELGEKDLPPIRYAVEGMIPEGYTVLSASPKMGKSWMAQQMCLAVAQGKEFLGRRTTKGKAIYIALEDCEKFAQDRQKMIGTHGAEGFMYVFDAPPMAMGFTKELDALVEGLTDLRLVVIDTLKRIEYQPSGKESFFHCDYRTGTELKEWADRHEVSLVAVVHDRKEAHGDPLAKVAGTGGVTAAADAVVMITKENRFSSDAMMAVTGRRVMMSVTKLRLTKNCVWEVRKGDDYKDSVIRQAVEKIADKGLKDALSAKQIIEMGGLHGISSRAVGTFLLKYKERFAEDGIDIKPIERGTASNTYHIGRIKA